MAAINQHDKEHKQLIIADSAEDDCLPDALTQRSDFTQCLQVETL